MLCSICKAREELEPTPEHVPTVIVSKVDIQRARLQLEEAGLVDKSRKIINAQFYEHKEGIDSESSRDTKNDGEKNNMAIPLLFQGTCLDCLKTACTERLQSTDFQISQQICPRARAMAPPTPYKTLVSELAKALNLKKLNSDLLVDVPRKWEIHEDLAMLPEHSFTHAPEVWEKIPKLWQLVAECLKVKRLARKAHICDNDIRESQATLLLGKNGEVVALDNGIYYSYDVLKCMYSAGNISEKIRISKWNCSQDVVVDLYAGIGYFTLPYLLKAKAKHLYACEWNPHAVHALRRNLELNNVSDRCTILEGDNQKAGLKDVADRINLGLIPTSQRGWSVAIAALKGTKGGWLHVHDNVTTKKNCSRSESWNDHGNFITTELIELAQNIHGGEWEVDVRHVEKVKSYAPHIYHLVFDIECRRKIALA
eukprot:m.28822 g.28822  ORF g.28822 m.28822 type:complete len:426 (-) comp8037_c0_seq3:54-1331(-)